MIKLKDLEAGKAYICKFSDLELLMIEAYKTPAVDKVYDYINIIARNPRLGQGFTENTIEEGFIDPLLSILKLKGLEDEYVQEIEVKEFRSTWKKFESYARKGLELMNDVRRKYKLDELKIAPFDLPVPF